MSRRLEFGNQVRASLEAIQRQDGRFYKELSECLDKLKSIPDISDNDIARSDLPRIIKKHTNMTVSFDVVKYTWDMAVHFVQVDKNHVLFEQRSSFIAYITANHETKKLEEIGGVDLSTSRVTGIFTEVPVKILVGSNYFSGFNANKEAIQYFTGAEIASLILHELGHAFSTFEFLGSTVMTGLLISSTVRGVMDMPEGPARTKIVTKACDNVNIQLTEDQVQDILRRYGENADAVILSETVRHGTALTKTKIYDARNFEQMADQFAVKHGAAPTLASGLEKLSKLGWDINYRHPVTYAVFEAMKITYTLATLVLSTVIFPPLGLLKLMIVISNIAEVKIYDDPKDRFIKMKHELIADLRTLDKNSAASTEIRKQIVESIELVERQISTVKDRETVSKAIWNVMTPWGRNRAQQEQKQKLLENAIDNELHLKTAQLTSL